MDAARRRVLHEAMTRLADGDRAAFHPVFQEAWPLVRGFANGVLRDETAAEDAAQQGLLKVFERASAFDPRRDALPWILGIVWNECRTERQRRRRRREEPIEPLAAEPRSGGTPEEEVIARDLVEAARRVLADLPPRDAETILFDLAEARPSSVAPATFRKRLERARQRLREAWRARHAG